ncbi:VWA domain-containing protein [Frankia sp. B2]|uniref:substrate-binding and VWA domain-containing protein n=1 Tax=unclassified Frankia TaxID=2632575 RepID=UPI000871FB23|nr:MULTISPECIES: substrate-binding and VWA domain-containing protein [unclassified Frankia]OFB43160.1 VWA domain-containing protein [Frankia sp. CgIM4]TFE30292.1 VWA domain-containing protein [Frankia sp. B2]
MSDARHRSRRNRFRGGASHHGASRYGGSRAGGRGRAVTVGLGIVSGAALLVLGALTATGIGFAARAAWDAGSAGECADGGERATLTITTAPALAAPISRLAADFDRQRAGAEGSAGPCVTLAVSVVASDRVLDTLSRPESPDSPGPPDVWIPESADWLELGQESDPVTAKLPAKATTIAGSPVVIAMPRLMAQRLGWPEHHVTWAELAAAAGEADFWTHRGEPQWGDFRFAMANPEHSAAALRAVIATVGAARGLTAAEMTTGTFDQDRAAQLTVLRQERSIDWLPEYDQQLFDSVRTGGTENGAAGSAPSAFPALEADVIAYNRSLTSQNGNPPATTLVASYPSDGMFTATVPYIVLKKTASSSSRRAAADAFAAFLRGDAGRAALSGAGFRTPTELAGHDDPGGLAGTLNATDGVRSVPPKLASTDASDSTLGTARRFFRHARQRGATLVALDSSGSMAEPVPGTDPSRTRLQAAVETSLAGLRLFAPDSQVGLWRFSGEQGAQGVQGYRDLVPMAALNAPGRGGTHRDELIAAQAGIVPGGATDLYATTLAAFRFLTQHYVPGRLNQVVILTDGRDTNRGAAAPSLDSLIEQLHAEYDPKRPVAIIMIAYSNDADLTALSRIAAATAGRSYLRPDPSQVVDIYLDALTRVRP